ncbi:hypothetical protein JB92DRAFT_2922559 [Gautieria morchelliformis]|nr:hypothetical protein JB92DRAFT_2922559 [Gautieria morchelliformis]
MPQVQLQFTSHRKACKECRRLRLGCDREVPCYNCKRRGCSTICPEGTLEKGARSRSTIIVELQETIAELRNWNYLLEEALNTLQASISSQPHPLLRDRKPSKLSGSPIYGHSPTVDEEEVLDALGTFAIRGDSGEVTSLYGPTATTEYLVRENPSLLPNFMERSDSPMSLPADIVLLSALFPFPPEPVPIEKLDDFVPHLPPYKTVIFLSELYYANYAWCSDPIIRPVFMASVVAECYPGKEPAGSLRRVSSHILSILFMLCGLGVLANPQETRRFVMAEEYHALARAALCIHPIYENPTISAVQSMTIMLHYHISTERRSNGYTLALWSVMGRLCETLGLNYDQRKLKTGCSEVREQAFWEAMNLDSWQAFNSGRAKSLNFKVITCKRPIDPDPHPGGGWFTWKHDFTAALDIVAEKAFREKGSTYSLIQLYEHELRVLTPPPSMAWPAESEKAVALGGSANPTRAMQRSLTKASFETALLHLHRWFFVQAIREMPENPFDHPFSHSVKTVIDSSHALIETLHCIYQYQPTVTACFRPLWTHAFSAAMVHGTFVVSCPHNPEAHSALLSLDTVCELFQASELITVHSLQSLKLLIRLREDAHQAWSERRASTSQVAETLRFWTNIPNPYGDATQ